MLPLVLTDPEDTDAVEVSGPVVDHSAGLGDRQVIDQIPPSPRALATADTLVRSIAKRCRIQRLQRRVVLARGSANAGMRCWKILVPQPSLSQVKRGTRTCSLVG